MSPSASSSSPRRVPDVLVERLHLGELPEHTAADVRRRLAAEPGGLERLAALEQSDRELLPRLPGPPQPHRLQPPRTTRPRWLAPALLTALATLALVAIPFTKGTDDLRPKGTALLTLHRLAGTGPELLSDGAAAARGDRLQLGARLPAPAFLAILSIDGRGVVTVHQPPTDTPVREIQVPSSFVLDDAPAYERFFLFTSETSLDESSLHQALNRLPPAPAALPALPPGTAMTELRLVKPPQ